MRFWCLLFLLSLTTAACKKESPAPVPVSSQTFVNQYWPLQKYKQWFYKPIVGNIRAVVLSPNTTDSTDYQPFLQPPFPSFAGLSLNAQGDLELIWKFMGGESKGILLPYSLPALKSSWYSETGYFYLVDDRAGIPLYDSLRFQVTYDRFWSTYTVPFDTPQTYHSILDLYISTQIWNIYLKQWESTNLPEHRLLLAKYFGPVVINNGIRSEFLVEAYSY